MNKTAIAYYTLHGSSAVVAQVLSERYSCDVIELEEAKPRGKGFFGFISAGFQAASNKKSKLKIDVNEKLSSYERIIVISPVWASKTVPAVNTLLSKLDLKDKSVVAFTIQADPDHKDAPKIAESIRQRVKDQGGRLLLCYHLHSKGVKTAASSEDVDEQLKGFFEAYKSIN